MNFQRFSRKQLFALIGVSLGAVAILVMAAVYWGKSPRQPMTMYEVMTERLSMPALFLTAKTGQRVIAEGDTMVFVDKKTGELCWRAMICDRKACPSKTTGDEPFLFINAHPGNFIQPDGTVGEDTPLTQKAAADVTTFACPACLKTRNLKSEGNIEQQYYLNLVRPYVLPETAKKLEAMDAKVRR